MSTSSGAFDEAAGRPAQSGFRASDVDRDRVVETLRAALGDGRLTPEEFEERVGAALAARTLDELPALTADLGPGPGGPAARPRVKDVLQIKERHGLVQRTGRWVLPRRLDLKVAWSGVTLDFTEAVITHDTLQVNVKMSGGALTLVIAPGIVVDVNELKIRHGGSDITQADPGTPTRLLIQVAGSMRHGIVQTQLTG